MSVTVGVLSRRLRRILGFWVFALRPSPFALSLLLAAVSLPHAAAHPMGNFTISHYAGLQVAPGEARLHYALDFAEIPTVQEQQGMDTDSDGKLSAAESDAYLSRARKTLPGGLTLRVNGASVPLTHRSADLVTRPGAGSLPTMQLHLQLVAPLPRRAGRLTLEYADTNYRERTGWKEIVTTAAPGMRLVESTAPSVSASKSLSAYPDDLLSAPPQQTEARVTVEAGVGPGALGPGEEMATQASTSGPSPTGVGGASAVAQPFAPAAGEPVGKRSAGRFAELLTTERLSGPVLLVSLLVAFVLGAAHALEPGHGKTVVAAYLVGTRGTARHALWLGLIVTLTHTLGVFALGLVTLFASAYIVPERLYPWLGALSGLAISSVGLSLLWRHGRHLYAHAHGLPHDHVHSHHGHGHDHDHDHDHHHVHRHVHPGHTHGHAHGDHHHDYEAVLEGRGVRLGSLIALGVSGGIVPCPGALVVLLSAIAMHRVGFGLALIVAFSAGLAAVLTGIGLLMVSARGFLDRFPALGEGRWSQRLALLSASAVSLLGLGIAVQALVG